MSRVHLRRRGEPICHTGYSRRWRSQQLTSSGSPAKVTCKHCLSRIQRYPQLLLDTKVVRRRPLVVRAIAAVAAALIDSSLGR